MSACANPIVRLLVVLPVLAFTPGKVRAQITNISISPEADAFVRAEAPADNYGRAGNLSVAGALATNGFGVTGGRADSLVRFQLNDAVAALDTTFGNQDWLIAGAVLRLYELASPNNPLFSRGVGTFEIRWLAGGDEWTEGTGSPSVPTMDGVGFQDLISLVTPARDASLGVFTNNAVDGPVTIPVPLLPVFVEDLRSGGPITLQFTPAGDSIGFTFLSRNDRREDLRIVLELTAVAGPPPRISVVPVGVSEVSIRFNARSNLTHVLQYRDSLESNGAGEWLTLLVAPAQPFDRPIQFSGVATNRQGFYRVSVSR